jgi:ligand-binding sensor domain-containing protein/DNA-binding CsgD family transcriptional regulator
MVFIQSINIVANVNIGLPKIETYEALDYNAAFQNWDIAQDLRGKLYFANNNGLLEFDGYNWTTYFLPNKTIARSVEIDDQGIIYCGGQNEFGKFIPDEIGQWKYHSLSSSFKGEFGAFEDVWNMCIYEDQVYFRSSERIYRYSDQTSKVYDDYDFQFLKIVEQKIFCQSISGALYLLNEHSGAEQFSKIKGSELLIGTLVTDITKGKGQSILIATEKNGLFKYESGVISPFNFQMSDFLKQNQITSIVFYNNEIIIGTSFAGLLYLNEDYSVKYHIHRENGLLNNKVERILIDHKKNLWLCVDKGINFININSPFNYIKPDGELDGIGYAVKIFNDKIYFGTNNGLYYKDWNDEKVQIERFEKYNSIAGSKGQVWGLDVVDNQLILSHQKGAFLVHNELAKPIYDKEGVWLFKELPNVREHFIVGTYDGIRKFGKIDEHLEYINQVSNLKESSRFIEFDNTGNIWMAHPYRGIYRINLRSKNSEYELYNEQDGLPSHLHNHVFKINDKVVFCAEKGIYEFNYSENRFQPYETLNNILGENIKTRRLKEDSHGNIWFITEKEIGLIIIEDKGLDKKIKKQVFEGLNELMNGGWEFIYPFDDSNIFLASVEGFIHYNPSKEMVGDSSITLLLNEVQAFGKYDSLLFSGSFFNGTTILLTPPNEQKVKLKSKFKNFQFKFSAIDDYNNIDKLTYRYKLVGLESNWSEWDEKTIKEYTRLSPGKYNFMLQAKNINGITSTVLSYPFEIKNPFYQTLLAKCIYFILVAFTLFFIFKRNKKRMQKLEHVIEETVTKSEEEIERLKNEKMKDELEHKNRELATSTMHLLQKNESMQEIMKNLIEIKKQCEHEPTAEKLKRLIHVVEQDAVLDEQWDGLMYHFNEVNDDFITRLKERCPDLTNKDLKLCTYLRMNLSTKEIAILANVSQRGIDASRYRLRKKLNLDSDTNLTEFLMYF